MEAKANPCAGEDTALNLAMENNHYKVADEIIRLASQQDLDCLYEHAEKEVKKMIQKKRFEDLIKILIADVSDK